MNAGEKRFAQRMEALLADEAVCWYDVAFGPKYQRPDFAVLDPLHGLLVLEVRDWKLEQILSVGRISMSLLEDSTCRDVVNPLEQARQYAATLRQILDHDPLLRCPVGHGLVLCNISRKEFNTAQMGAALPAEQVICKDEMTESIAAEQFQQRLWDMLGHTTLQPLDAQQVNRVRYHLFPELRIQQTSLFSGVALGAAKTGQAPAPLLVMDLEQERLARSLGDGHRVIHGVAGSGKTMILAYRCTQLARNSDKPILVLCYNDSLAAKLELLITDPRLLGRIIVRPFHAWCLDQLRLHRIGLPTDGPGFPGRLVRSVTQAVAEQRIPDAQYGAVLIDEGHDFEPEWFKLLAQMVDPSNNSLLLLYDDAQSIYGKKRSRAYSFAKVGIQARGRTTILRVNYRNSAEVLEYAYSFAKEALTPEEDTSDDDAIPFVSPQSSGRHGRAPTLTQCNSLPDEARHIAQQLRLLHAQGCKWKDMAVLYPAHFVGEAMAAELRAQQLPVEWQPTTRFNPEHDSIKLMTLHSSKGLEFPVVAIAGLGYMPYQEDEAMEDTRLLYIGMTRAVERLILTAHQSSEFVKQLLKSPHGAVSG